ncbi:MAG TPA: bifunctional adenosylcobinamide kinase/adenosylcobinamide-phosphate guanylyltransferase [Clostridiaceae bacterium]|nr:bifunctional adenosylcobinamide kinase/adenosylcobinamide-phosphate guanylyltransferase [Clostridiaceae bacterium]
MGKLILITGGARSGKSSLGEKLAKEAGQEVLYIATAIPFDEEMESRIKKHRETRPANWETVEAYKDLDMALCDKINNKDAVLLDCITVMVSNLMLEKAMDWENISVAEIDEAEARVMVEVNKLMNIAKKSETLFILVTNELGMGIVPTSKLGRAFRDIGGRVNQLLAKEADEVYFCVSGIPMKIK